jgi:hypothetical protein
MFDAQTATTVHTETRQELVYLSKGRLEFLQSAVRSGLKPVIVSDGLSSLTDPMLRALVRCGGGWAVRGGEGVLRNGLTGRVLDRIESAVDHSPVTQLDQLAISHLRPVGTDCAPLVVHLAMAYPATGQTTGSAAQCLAAWASGQAPASIGPVEPAGRPWSPATLGRKLARWRRLRLVASGTVDHPAALSLALDRHGRTVTERLSGLVAIGPATNADTFARAATLPQAMDALAAGGDLLFGLLGIRVGRFDLTRPPMLPHFTTPLALFLGRGQVEALDIDLMEAARCHAGVRPLAGGLMAQFEHGGGPAGLTLPQLACELGLGRATPQLGFSPGHAAALRAGCGL